MNVHEDGVIEHDARVVPRYSSWGHRAIALTMMA